MNLKLLTLLAAVVVAMTAAPAEAKRVPPLWNMAYGNIVRPNGNWAYGSGTGLTPGVVLPKIESSGAVFVRAGLGPPRPATASYFDQLHAADPQIRIGTRLELAGRSVQRLLDVARRVRNSPKGCGPPSGPPCYFDWLYLDGVHRLKTKPLQRLITRLQETGPTDGGGWRHVMTNDTGSSPRSKLPHGEWAHGHGLKLLGNRHWGTGRRHLIRILRHGRSLITSSDRQFIKLVHRRDPGSHPVLKFEIHNETDRLQTLSFKLQRTLIRRLSAEQQRYHFRMVYPLFVSSSRGSKRTTCRTGCKIYNSLAGSGFSAAAAGQHTYALQRRLMLNSPLAP